MRFRPTIAALSVAACALTALPAAARPYLMLQADDDGFTALDMGGFVRTPQSPYADDRILRPAPAPAAPASTSGAMAATGTSGDASGRPSAPSSDGAGKPDGQKAAGQGRRNPQPPPPDPFADARAAFDPSLNLGLGIPAPAGGPRPAAAATAQAAASPETFPASGPRLQDPRTQGVLGAGEGAARLSPAPEPHPLFVPDRVEATLISAPLAGAPYGDKLAPLVEERVEFDCREPRWRVLSRTYSDAHEVILAKATTAQEWLPLDPGTAAPLAQAALCRRQFRQAAVSRFLNIGEVLANYQAARGKGTPQPRTREQLLAERFRNSH